MSLKKTSRQRIAIIGAGFAGAVTALKLIHASQQALQITFFESTHELGRGIAYSTRNNEHLVNGPARGFGLYPEHPLHLAEWLQKNAAAHGWQPPAGVAFENSFPPRWLFGTYVQDSLQIAVRDAGPRVQIEQIKQRVTDLQAQGLQYLITSTAADNSSHNWQADQVVLATGLFRTQPGKAFAIAAGLHNDRRLIDDVWRDDAWTHIREDASVLIIGSSLTALDAVLSAEKQGFQGNYIAISRRGLLVNRRDDVDPWPQALQAEQLPDSLRALLRQVQAARRAIRDAGDSWQRLPGAVRPHLPLLWQRASLRDKQRFLRHLRPYWEIALHRAAPESGRKFEQVVASGRYRQKVGAIVAVRPGPDRKLEVQWRPRGSGELHSLLVDRVINAQGYEFDWRKIDDPLIAQLLRRQLVRIHATGFGIDADPDSGAIIGADQRHAERLFAVGHPMRGAVWESNSIGEQLAGAQATALAMAAGLQRLAADADVQATQLEDASLA